MTDLSFLAWPDVAAAASQSVLAIPVGSTEQHGPHLPLSTDTDIAVALTRRLAEVRSDVMVAPALSYGSSGEHAGFPGTLSIGQAALEVLVVELVRSADAFAAVLLVSAHGGNVLPLGRAVDQLISEGRRVRMWGMPAAESADAHAGHTETSVLLAIRPEAVRTSRAEAGVTAPLHQLLPELRRHGVASVSPNGVLGDPTDASGTEGLRLMSWWSERLLQAIQGWP
jgi:creatinine amidohydrolase